MPYSPRPKAEGRRKRLSNTSIAASGARDVGSADVVMSNETETTVVDQGSAEIGTTDSEMFITDTVNEDCDSYASTVTVPRMQRGSESSEQGLNSVAPFVERNPDRVASTLEWRRRVLHAQQAAQVTSSHQRNTAEVRSRALLELKIEQIRKRYREQERILAMEIAKHEQRYEWAMKQLEQEEKDEEHYPVAEWWEVQSDYQPTECGNDGSR